MVNDRIEEVQYRHYRLIQYDEKVDKLVPATKGGVTVAFKFFSPRVVDAGLALCSPEDNFDKAEGRRLAEDSRISPGYLSFTQSFSGALPTEDDFEAQVLLYLYHLVTNREQAKRLLPRRDFIAWEKRTHIPRWLGTFVRKRVESILNGRTLETRWRDRPSPAFDDITQLHLKII